MKHALLLSCLLWAPLALAQDHDPRLLAEWERLAGLTSEMEALIAPIASDQPASAPREALLQLREASYFVDEVSAAFERFVEHHGGSLALVDERLAQQAGAGSSPSAGDLAQRVRAASEAIPRLREVALSTLISRAEAALAEAQANPDDWDRYQTLEESFYALELVAELDPTSEAPDAVHGEIAAWLGANDPPAGYAMECGTADLMRVREAKGWVLIVLGGGVLLALVIGWVVVASRRWRLV